MWASGMEPRRWPAPSSSAYRPRRGLPFLDEYVVAYKDRAAIVTAEDNARVESGNIIFHQPILIDGRVAGVWTRQLKKGTVQIATTLFRPLSQGEQEALAAVGRQYGEFLGLTTTFA